MPPGTLPAQPPAHSIDKKRKLNTTQMRRFSIPIPGEQERRFFYALMLRIKGEKSLSWSDQRPAECRVVIIKRIEAQHETMQELQHRLV